MGTPRAPGFAGGPLSPPGWDPERHEPLAQPLGARYFFLTTKTTRAYYDVTFRSDDFLVFGRETKGLPENLLASNIDNCITIPMCGTRSLNLATAVAIVLFEAMRQQRRGVEAGR